MNNLKFKSLHWLVTVSKRDLMTKKLTMMQTMIRRVSLASYQLLTWRTTR